MEHLSNSSFIVSGVIVSHRIGQDLFWDPVFTAQFQDFTNAWNIKRELLQHEMRADVSHGSNDRRVLNGRARSAAPLRDRIVAEDPTVVAARRRTVACQKSEFAAQQIPLRMDILEVDFGVRKLLDP